MKIKIIFIVALVSFCFVNCNSQHKITPLSPTADTSYSFYKGSADGIGKFYKHREIAHVMGVEGSDWLERNDRNKEENTQMAIAKISIPSNGVIADIGAGTGYYTFKLTRKVPQGKVYAVDVQDEFIAYLNNKKQMLKDSIVEVVKGTALSPNLPANSVDLAIMVDVYHELEYPHEMLEALSKSLKKDGKILLIEYRGEDPAIAIKALHKTTVSQLNSEMEANGFKLYSQAEFLPIQHFLLYEKKEVK